MDFQIIYAVLTAGIILGALLFFWISRLIGRFILWKRFRKARIGQERAEKLLKKNGYKVLAKEFSSKLKIKIDDELLECSVRADFIVESDGLIYVAEVKTGDKATSILDSSTRRQLLEYDFVFKPDGILLVDMDERKIHTVQFIGGLKNWEQ